MDRVKPGLHRDNNGDEKPLLLHDPVTKRIIPPEGGAVNIAEAPYFWARAFRDGDAVLLDGPDEPTAAPQAAPKKAASLAAPSDTKE